MKKLTNSQGKLNLEKLCIARLNNINLQSIKGGVFNTIGSINNFDDDDDPIDTVDTWPVNGNK